MPELLVVVVEVTAVEVRAVLAVADRPGDVSREAAVARSADLPADTAAALERLAAGDLAPVLLALAVAVGTDVGAAEAGRLRAALSPEDPAELGSGWRLPTALPVLHGSAQAWATAGAPAAGRPVVAGAVVAAARSVGAHAHLPREPGRGPAAGS